MPLSLQEQITQLRGMPIFGRFLVAALQNIENGVNTLGTNVAADPTGTLPPPASIQGVNVATDGGNLVHVTLTHNQPTQRNLRYFVEWSDNTAFQNSHVEDLGASRGRVLNLPQGTYYVRGYHQPQGGLPSKPVNYGSQNVPTAVTITTGSTLTLLPSRGSGTAQPDGGQPGWGLGKTLYRAPIGPKRS
jgi:hypothetical protein